MFKEYIDVISKTPLFKGIEKSEISVMLECIRPRVCSFSRNDCIIIPGAAFESVGIILTGEATVNKESASGNRVILSVLEEGDIFGELLAFSAQSVWSVTVQAQEACKVLFMPSGKIIDECSRMCPWHRSMIQNFLGIISERALILNKRVEYLTIKSIRGKLSTYLLEQYKRTGDKNITLSLNRNALADFLNVSRPSMSREMCHMRNEGIIDFHLKAFRILDVEALKAMSNL